MMLSERHAYWEIRVILPNIWHGKLRGRLGRKVVSRRSLNHEPPDKEEGIEILKRLNAAPGRYMLVTNIGGRGYGWRVRWQVWLN